MPSVATSQIQDKIDRLFSAALLEQRKINHLKKADSGKESFSQKILGELQKSGENSTFSENLFKADGHGPLIKLPDGSIKYNLSQIFGSNLLGQSHPIYLKTMIESSLEPISDQAQFILEHEQLARQQTVPYLGNSKLKHLHFFESIQSMNNTLCTSLLTQNDDQVIAINKQFSYSRSEGDGLYLSSSLSTQDIIYELNNAWVENPNKYKIIYLELINADSGYTCKSQNYYGQILEWAKNKKLLVWIDENQTFGRTHSLFCHKMLNLESYVDIVTFGNVLHAHAVLVSDKVEEQLKNILPERGNRPISIKLANKLIRYLTNANFYGEQGRIQEIESQIVSRLRHASQSNPNLKQVNAIGTFLSLETKNSKQDFVRLFDNGLIAQPTTTKSSRLNFLLPLCLGQQHIQEICSIIGKSINE